MRKKIFLGVMFLVCSIFIANAKVMNVFLTTCGKEVVLYTDKPLSIEEAALWYDFFEKYYCERSR